MSLFRRTIHPDGAFPVLSEQERFDFPDPATAPEDSPLCWGGDLSPGMLLSAYEQGIFPWFSPSQPILWWSPNPRFVIQTDEVHVSDSMRKVLRQKQFTFTFDTRFSEVIRACSTAPRHGQNGTWITEQMIAAYENLHSLGYAHSVEAWQDGLLAGGLYGVGVGRLFCGESMFSFQSNASKASFLTLAPLLKGLDIPIIDSQVHTPLFESLGARLIPRGQYLAHVKTHAREISPLAGSWTQRFSDLLRNVPT